MRDRAARPWRAAAAPAQRSGAGERRRGRREQASTFRAKQRRVRACWCDCARARSASRAERPASRQVLTHVMRPDHSSLPSQQSAARRARQNAERETRSSPRLRRTRTAHAVVHARREHVLRHVPRVNAVEAAVGARGGACKPEEAHSP
jgi:hypothetical protein